MVEIPDVTDPLGEALHFLRMSGVFYARCEFSAPWGLDLPDFKNSLMFHIVVRGSCWLEIGDTEPALLQSGDMALTPHGNRHQLVSRSGIHGAKLFDLPREEIGDRYEVLRQDGSGALTTLICGAVRFDHPAARHLIDMLPEVITVEAAASTQWDWIQSTLRFIAEEARMMRPGGETMITRLADILVIQGIRDWIEHYPEAQEGWLGALRDPQIGQAIRLIHHDPAQPWTVEDLAGEAAMSRSAFSARFTSLVGEPPMRYVTRWRMYLALTMLRDEGPTLHEIAIKLGYQSEAAFSRAFKRLMGVSPGATRQLDDYPRPARA